ncbi:LytS/YhcK type 5TM receptor domain-containing protein [Paenibacillus ihbetae]|uniref:histidine kinase n=1 Tax=Paenibacillus ihbetae TaxID=1870820 RepID=A0ABX3K3B5_9BACL|nr:LytS/YhcK type 5TM receptor domain-containing protein [Paenibacillus ihbetae]OOC63925.1 sensor histidine kinase [Paenibacillus ihbetae]
MQELALHLFERMGMLLILAFILTRIPLFRQLLDRKGISGVQSVFYSCLFGLFGILGTYAGVVVEEGGISTSFWLMPLTKDQALAHAALVGVVIGGLMGGPRVGFGGGLLAGAHLLYMGGYTGLAGAITAPLIGVLAGGVARFFAQERVVSPAKALFVGMFAEVLFMGVILICADDSLRAIELVNLIGLPMVLTNSISIAVFTTMLRVALAEEERAAAYETEKALHIAEAALPHLKQGLTYRTAQAVADLLLRELKTTTAVAVTDTERLLAHAGAASRTIEPGEEISSSMAKKVIATGELHVVDHAEDIQTQHPSLGAAILVPMLEGSQIVGVIQLYFKRPQDIGRVELAMARGLGQLISYQLGATSHENMAKLMKEAELKLLQAQIHPHFLYNTLNAIHSLIRSDPQLARHATMQLGAFMRLNAKLMASRATTVREEMELLRAYLDIIQIRFEDQFNFHCELEPGLEELQIPPATLQMLVENSIKHGLRNTASGGLIKLTLRRDGDMAVVLLEDNGSGISPGLLEHLGERPLHESGGTGIGIYNINQRLMGMYGREARLIIENRAEGGLRISFRIPCSIPEGSRYREAN